MPLASSVAGGDRANHINDSRRIGGLVASLIELRNNREQIWGF